MEVAAADGASAVHPRMAHPRSAQDLKLPVSKKEACYWHSRR